MFTYLFDGFLRRVFSLLRAGGIIYIYIALVWRHRYFLSKILFRFFTRSLGMRLALSVHDDISLENWFFSYFCWRKKVPLPLEGSGQSLAFFLPFPGHRVRTSVGFQSVGDPFGLLSLSPEWGYRVQIAWPIFFHAFNGRPKLTYILYFSFNGQSLAAC